MSRLGRAFSGGEAVWVLERIAPFKQAIQAEILRRSGGRTDLIDGLVAEAQEGAFDLRTCGGLRCGMIQSVVAGAMTEDDLHAFIAAASRSDPEDEARREAVREAARLLWGALARGAGDGASA